MTLTVLTPEKELFSGEIRSVRVPGKSGQFEILTGHAPIVSSLDPGIVHIVREDGNAVELEIASGFIEVLRDDISLLVREKTAEEAAEG
jgi:F-type H+-transporting ATPase subunit epsilon